MVAKEHMGKKRSGKRLSVSVVMRLSDTLVRFLLTAVLTGGEILGGHAPFALCFVAVCRPGIEGFGALLGAVLGYLSFWGFTEGLRYIAACMMVYAVGLALGEFELYRRRWFMPLLCTGVNMLVGFVYQAAEGWSRAGVVGFVTEVFLTAVLVYFYRLSLDALEKPRSLSGLPMQTLVGVLVLGVTVMLALANVTVADRFSVGRVLCVLAVALAGWKGGVGVGSAAGVIAGLTMDLSAETMPFYTLAYAVPGLVTGIFSGQNRFLCAVAYAMSAGAAMLWSGTAGYAPHAVELGAGLVIFLILPDKLLRRIAFFIRQEPVGEETERLRRGVQQHLQKTAQAFRAVTDSLDGAFPQITLNDSNNIRIFDRAAERVCVKCRQRERCWQQEYQATRTALADALPAMMDRGEGHREDFPAYFSGRCVQMEPFLRATNRELTALLYRRSYDSRVRESRVAVCAQYGHLADFLQRQAEMLGKGSMVDEGKLRQFKQRMTALGLEGRCRLWQDELGHWRAEMDCPGSEILTTEAELRNLGELLGCALRVESREEDLVRLAQKEPLMAIASVSASKREGQSVSGDTGAWFKDDRGHLFVILCDGMGSGHEAKADSTCARNLLEQFLRAGLGVEETLTTVGEALALRGEEKGGFTTVDLLSIDLFTGEGCIYKQGAAPTYVRQADGVSCFAGAALPAGIGGGADRFPVTWNAGDWVVMVSDGVADHSGDGWLRQIVSEFREDSPRLLADRILAESGKREGRGDDRTVMVLKIEARK